MLAVVGGAVGGAVGLKAAATVTGDLQHVAAGAGYGAAAGKVVGQTAANVDNVVQSKEFKKGYEEGKNAACTVQ